MSEQASSEVPQRHLIVRAVLRTDTGLVRAENQDFGTYTTAVEEEGSGPGGRLLIVADGMGGHRGGATASRLAGEIVKAQYLGSETTNVAAALLESLTRANARIYSEAQSNPELRGMGTTTSVLAVRGDHGWLAHVGDSRIYMIRGDEIRQLTEDHSLVATMVREGLLTTQEAESHPRRNVLQRSMGVSEQVEIDVHGPFDLREGDTFILCSDGLHGVVREQELKEIARASLDDAADEFVRRALERGAPDNVTVIVARLESTSDPAEIALVERWEEADQRAAGAFDDTMKDTQPVPAVPEPEDEEETARIKVPEIAAPATAEAIQPSVESVPSPAPAPPAPPPVRAASATTQAARRATPRPPATPQKSRPLLRWAIVLVLILGAAGAFLYWTQTHTATEGTTSSSR